jgi:RNA methyltransferase, TrmH family
MHHMTHITSANNPRLRSLRRLRDKRERERSQSFLVEGEDLIAAAEAAGARMLAGYRLAGSGLGGEGFIDVEAAPLRSAGVLSSGARVIGVYEQRWSAPSGPLCVYLHGLSDPGNVGAVLRSAEAFGASCVALGLGCADPYSPKAVRASMGAIFSVPVARVHDLDELPGERIALSPDGSEVLGAAVGDAGPGREVTILVGAERAGLPQALLARCERRARIPIATHSLNAAMAATIALYELSRASSQGQRSSRVRAR